MNVYRTNVRRSTAGSSDMQPFDSLEPPASDASSGFFDLRKAAITVWRGKWLLLFLIALGLAAGGFHAGRQEPVYRATASILFEPERLEIVDIADVLSEQDSASNLGNQIEILSSTMLLERVVNVLDLAQPPTSSEAPAGETAPPAEDATGDEEAVRAGVAEVLIQTGISDLAAQVRNRIVELTDRVMSRFDTINDSASHVVELTPEERQAQARRQAVQRLRRNLAFSQVSGSRVIEITSLSSSPHQAALIANTVGEEYISSQQTTRNADVSGVIEIMNRRIADLKAQLESSEQVLENARLEVAEEQSQSADMTQVQINTLNQELAQVRLQLSEAESRHDRAARALEENEDLWTVTEFRNSDLIANFRQREIEIREQMAREQAIVGGSSSPSKTVNAALLEQVHQSIREEASYIVAALEFEVDALRDREEQLSAMVQDLEVTAIEQRADELKIERLQREVQANETLYQSFVDRVKEITEQANLESADARFLSRAEKPPSPDRQHAIRQVAAAGGAGLLLGLCLVFLREHVNNAFQNPGELTQQTGMPVLASIPQTGGRRNARKLVDRFLARPKSILAESVRNLRTSVLYANPADQPKVVMFTSSVPGEGKTVLALLTGIASQQTGRHAILISCDLRDTSNVRLYSTFPPLKEGATQRHGLGALLAGRCDLEDALGVEPKTGLHLLALGPKEGLRESPADVLSSDKFSALLDELRDRYDLVILDTPPALAVTDARLLTRLSDRSVYLVRWNRTNKSAVKEGLRELLSMNANVAGCVFTLVSQKKARKYADNEFFYKQAHAAYYS